MYKVLKRTCWAIVLPISSFVFPCPRCRHRRGLLKVLSKWKYTGSELLEEYHRRMQILTETRFNPQKFTKPESHSTLLGSYHFVHGILRMKKITQLQVLHEIALINLSEIFSNPTSAPTRWPASSRWETALSSSFKCVSVRDCRQV